MARPAFPGSYPNANVQADNYGPGGWHQTGPEVGDQSSQWQTTQNVQGYPQQWDQTTRPSPSPPTPLTTPPMQYNPSMYGMMPGGQSQQHIPPPPTYAQVQQQLVQQPSYGERPPSAPLPAHPYPPGPPPTRPPLSSIPSGYQAEVQQNQQGWPQHPPYSSHPPSQTYEPANQGEHRPYNYGGYGDPSQDQPSNSPPPPPPPKQPQTAYPPPPPPKPYAPSSHHDPSLSSTSVYSGDGAPISSPTPARPGYAQSFPPAQQQYSPVATQARPVATPPGSVPSWASGQPQAPGATPSHAGTGQQQLSSNQQNDYGSKLESQQGFQYRPTHAFQGPQIQSTHIAMQSQSAPLQASSASSYASAAPPIQTQLPHVPPTWQSQGSTAQPVQGQPHESQYDHQAEPVSPIQRHSIASDRIDDGQFTLSAGPSRTASLISRTSVTGPEIQSPPPLPEKRVTAPTNVSTTSASALGFGGPSDWEYYGAGPEEVDDTAMYGSKVETQPAESQPSHGIELPSDPSPTREDSRPVVPQKQLEAEPGRAPAAQTPQRSNEMSPQKAIVGRPTQQNPEAQHVDAAILAPAPSHPVQDPAATGHVLGARPPSRPNTDPPIMTSGRVPSSSRANGFTVGAGRPVPPGKSPTPPVTKNPEVILVTKHEAAVQKLQTILDNLQVTVSQQNSSLEEIGQQLNDQRQLAQKEATEAQRAREEAQNLQKNIEEMNAAHAAVKDELNNQRDRLQSKLAETETALTTAKEKHENERADLQTKLGQAETAAASAKEIHATECEALRAQITEKEESLASAKADIDRITGKLEKQNQRIQELEVQLEAEKNKPAPVVDIAPGLDPWFKGSLERFREGLYAETAAPTVQEKLKVFIDFVNGESRLRGIDLPFGPSGEPKGFAQQSSISPHDSSSPQSAKTGENKAQRPAVKPPLSDYVVVEPDQYSPGGRPVVLRTSMQEQGEIPRTASAATSPPLEQDTTASASVDKPGHASVSEGQTYKPYKRDTPSREAPDSQDSKTAVRRPTIDTNQPAYKPFTYKPNPSSVTSPTAPPFIRASASSPAVPTQATVQRRPQEETFLEDPSQQAKQRRHSTEAETKKDPAMLPEPLKPKTPGPPSQPPADPKSLNAKDKDRVTMTPLERLAAVLPQHPPASEGAAPPTQLSPRLEALNRALAELPSDYSWIQDLTHAFETKASANRARLGEERSRRLAEVEQRSNELFDAGEIGYEDIAVLEEKAQNEEREKEAREEKEEYERYSKEVFDVVFGRLQEEIGKVVQLENEATAVVEGVVAGRRALDVEGHAHVVDAIGALLAAQRALEQRHDKIADAVKERDKNYKRMQTKPLYAKGDIAEMKRLEKHFEANEKRTEVRFKLEKVERCKLVWTKVEKAVSRGTKENEECVDEILSAIEGIRAEKDATEKSEEMTNERKKLLIGAKEMLKALSRTSVQLMLHFERVEMDLNDCEYEVSVASAKLKGESPEVFQQLKKEKATEDEELKEESKKRLAHIEQDLRDAEALINKILGVREVSSAPMDEEIEKKARLDAALKEAKRRNHEVI